MENLQETFDNHPEINFLQKIEVLEKLIENLELKNKELTEENKTIKTRCNTLNFEMNY